ncbi:MAG: hypothetical protein N3A64_01215 [Desulfobacterota bacterium]|nr:hypothetical protein [Thermodesulfobacteriota bacterium]
MAMKILYVGQLWYGSTNVFLYMNIFTTKNFGVKKITISLGYFKVIFIGNSYNPNTHHPMNLSEEEKMYGGTVGFTGDYENSSPWCGNGG